jgi:hypothetical protein
VVISDALDGPCRPYFDSAGDLWSGNFASNTAVEFTKAQLTKSGHKHPTVVLSSRKYSAPGDVAVSASGALWVPYMADKTVAGFTKAELSKSGSPAPHVAIVGPKTGLNWPWAVTVEP